MERLDKWLDDIADLHQNRKHDQELEVLILNTPTELWGPEVNEMQSAAIGYWLDGCLQIYLQTRYSAPEKAYQYLQLAYSRLQQVACNPVNELNLRDWCMKRLQHLAVLSLEFCNQQTQASWQTRSHQLIEAHVHFMAAQSWNETRKDDQGKYASPNQIH